MHSVEDDEGGGDSGWKDCRKKTVTHVGYVDQLLRP